MLYQTKPNLLSTANAHLFAQKVVNLFSGAETANLQDYLYSTPDYPGDMVQGAHLLDKMYQKCSAYYLQAAEFKLIQNAAESIALELGINPVLIDYGPGPVQSVIRKTLPILSKLIAPESYIPIDVCEEYINEAKYYISSLYPGLEVNPICFDYYDPILTFRGYRNPIIYFSGSSMFNCPGSAKKELDASLMQRLGVLAKQLGKDGKLLVTHDTNQQEQSLLAAYKNTPNEKFILNILHRIKRDVFSDQFDPEKFTHYVSYRQNTCAVEIGIEATENQTIFTQGQKLVIEKGRRYAVTNSLKYASGDFIRLCQKTGFRPLNRWDIPGNPMVMHLLTVE